MGPLERAGIIAGLIIPLLAAAWWAGSGYVEVSDRLTALEDATESLKASVADLAARQIKDGLVNEKVTVLEGHVDWLRYHHHDRIGGKGHVD